MASKKSHPKPATGIAVVEAPVAQPEPHDKLMEELNASIVKEKIEMPRGVRKNGAASTAKSVYVKFTEPEDIALYERLVHDARVKRYDVSTFITLVLLEAYPAPVPTSAE